MMSVLKKSISYIFLLFPILGFAQSGVSYPYFLNSQNNQYYLKSIPFASQMYHTVGRTDVFRAADTSLVYSIPRYFDPKGIVLSNDGNHIFYFHSLIYNYDGYDENIIKYYENGKLTKSYKVDELVERNLDDYWYYFFYVDYDSYKMENGEKRYFDTVPLYMRKILNHPLFSDGASAFVATKDREILHFNFDNGSLINRLAFSKAPDIINSHYYVPNENKLKFATPGTYVMPLFANGESYVKVLEKALDLKQDRYSDIDIYKFYQLKLTCLIDHEGNCLEVHADFEDSALSKRIEDLLLNQKFDPDAVPEITEKWYFNHGASFRKADTQIAVKERIEEKKQERIHRMWLIKQDSINGVYIPKNIDDCMRELDLIMTENNKINFKESNPINYHMGLGRNLRNRWGLWGASRLSVYFTNFGIDHPDDMSGIILESFHRHLNEKPINFEEQIKSISRFDSGMNTKVPWDLLKIAD